jgi:hypothetical protein
MKLKMTTTACLLGAGVLASASAHAQVLNFVGLQDNEPVGNYYNGGTGGFGSGPGPNYGITFGSDSLALISDGAGGSGNFPVNAGPSDTALYFLSGPGDVMDKASGFTTGFSFFYADQVGFTGSVTVWSGLDGTGTELASLSLPSTPDPYNVFVPIGVAFGGTAESVIFSGSANFIAFEDITLNSATPGAVPDTIGTSLYLVAIIGLAGAAWASRRQAGVAI